MFRVVLEEVGSGVKHVTTYSIVHIPLIHSNMLAYSTSAWNFPVGSRYIGNPGGILCEGQAIQNLGQSECHAHSKHTTT